MATGAQEFRRGEGEVSATSKWAWGGVISTSTHQFWPICWLDCFAHFIHSFFSYFLSFHYLGGGCSPSTFVRGLCPRPPCFRHLCCFMHVISCKFMTLRMINKTLFWYSRWSVWQGSGSSRICGRVRGLRRQPKMGGGGVTPMTTYQFWPIFWLDGLFCSFYLISPLFQSIFVYFLSCSFIGRGCTLQICEGTCLRSPFSVTCAAWCYLMQLHDITQSSCNCLKITEFRETWKILWKNKVFLYYRG